MAVDWDNIKDELEDVIVDRLGGAVEASAEDLRSYGAAIAVDLTRALQSNDEDLLEELAAQSALLAEVNRIRFTRAGSDILDTVLDVAMRLGGALLA